MLCLVRQDFRSCIEYRISGEGDEDSKQSVSNAIQDWDLLIDNLIFVEKQDDSSSRLTSNRIF